MTAEHRISEIVQNSIETTMQGFEELMPKLLLVGDMLAECLLNERKILCCGEGSSGLLAQLLATQLLNRCQHERPGLPAISLCSDAATLTAISSDNNATEIFSRQVRALAQPGDALVVVNNGRHLSSSLQAIQSAHDREATVVVLCNDACEDLSSLLQPEDIALPVPGDHGNRVLETQCIIINCLCELIDHKLFGSEE